MIKLYLDNAEVFPTATQSITVSKENPYFTLSESYTLDVEIPLDIPENRKFFRNIERIDASKRYKTFDALMTCVMGVLIKGTARLTKSTESMVNLQITMGISAVKMIADNSELYIDEMNLGYCPQGERIAIATDEIDEGVRHDIGDIVMGGKELALTSYGIPFVDITNDVAVNIGNWTLASAGYIFHREYVSMCPKLLDVVRNVFLQLGFVLDMSILPEAAEHLYIITGIHADYAASKLPHWTVARFLEELQNFFACVIVSDGDHRLKMVSVKDYAHNNITEIEPSASFEVNYTQKEETKGLVNMNVAFSIDGGDIEVIADDILASAESIECHSNYADALWSYQDNLDKNIAKRTIYNVNGGLYVGWDYDDGGVELKRIAPFNPLKRYEDAETVELAICPATMIEGYIHNLMCGFENNDITLNLISVNNPMPLRKRTAWGKEEDTLPTLQQLIEGEESLMEPANKGDVMPVAFLGDNRKKIKLKANTSTYVDTTIALAFTDSKFKQEPGLPREPWTLSLQDLSDYEFCLGKLHKLPFEINRKSRICFKFLRNSIPDPTNIYYCRGKKYACEKIDISIVEGEASPLMTGYFYELKE